MSKRPDDVVDAYNKILVPASRCRGVRNISFSLKKKIELSLDEFDLQDWQEAFRISWRLRGFTEHARVSLARFFYEKNGSRIIDKILAGEYDSWKRPVYPASMAHPSLDEVIFDDKMPLDWLRAPSGMCDIADHNTSFKYVARMLDDKPHLKEWIRRTVCYDRNRNLVGKHTAEAHVVMTSMRGLLNCLLIEDEFYPGWDS